MKQIIAMGGGGFSMEPDNLLLDRYILNQASSDKPKVCFLPTASGDAEGYIERFYESFGKLHCEPSHLSLFKPPSQDLQDFVLEKDIFYVGGGNTKNLLALWREWGLDLVLHDAWNQGIILAGLSAGAICWFEEGVTDSFGRGLTPLPCLGFLKGSHCPHYDGEKERRPSYQTFVASEKMKAGIAADDGVALHYKGQALHRVVSSRPNARAFKVTKEDAESTIHTEYIGEEGFVWKR
ncbi:peptidase E [Alteribacter aurantiacus]|uniref:Type 1 glutamine amidotransferase-like domain-containing protein n=1 Tax=Alteribacter aurantiacus TaxID=254410 RepID=UPI0004063AFB|nr:peptidase E [Alteribacter aurantiacus]